MSYVSAESDWQADTSDPMQLKASETIGRFLQKKPQLKRFFEQAYGSAVCPSVIRAGLVFGGAYGRGLVIEQNALVGSTSQWVFTRGPQLGAQRYSQVILFKDSRSMEWFKQKHVEFIGRASAVALKKGRQSIPLTIRVSPSSASPTGAQCSKPRLGGSI